MFNAIIQPMEKNKKSKIIKIGGCDKKQEIYLQKRINLRERGLSQCLLAAFLESFCRVFSSVISDFDLFPILDNIILTLLASLKGFKILFFVPNSYIFFRSSIRSTIFCFLRFCWLVFCDKHNSSNT